MKLEINDRIKSEDDIYAVVSVILSTVYLQKAKDNNKNKELRDSILRENDRLQRELDSVER